jgi:hypothetical protein
VDRHATNKRRMLWRSWCSGDVSGEELGAGRALLLDGSVSRTSGTPARKDVFRLGVRS